MQLQTDTQIKSVSSYMESINYKKLFIAGNTYLLGTVLNCQRTMAFSVLTSQFHSNFLQSNNMGDVAGRVKYLIIAVGGRVI